jgi:hypothetical protein
VVPVAPLAVVYPSVYEVFNYFECVAWLTVAIVLPFRFRAALATKGGIIARASLTFVAFGISDYLEAPMHGRLPPWLWAWKILCVGYLLKCRYDYLGRERFRWLDRINVVALVCFLTVLLIMFLQYYFRDLL